MKILLGAIIVTLFSIVECGPFTATISITSEYAVGEDITCHVTITNNHNKDYWLLMRKTPLEGLKSPIFSIIMNGKVIRYDGPLFKRGQPSQKEYIRILAKSSLESVVDLSLVYSFSTVANYSVQLNARFHYFEHDIANSSVQYISSAKHQFVLKDRGGKPKLTKGELLQRNSSQRLKSLLKTQGLISPAFAGSGASSDRSTGAVAYSAAYNILHNSHQSVTSNPRLYKKWFGTTSFLYPEAVKHTYIDIKSSMEDYQYTLYFHGPECEPLDYAYTFYKAKVVYLCEEYFNAPTVGYNSKMGTIIHEMSHAVADTDDIAYGEADCQALAATNPSKAIRNADNYEFFSESIRS